MDLTRTFVFMVILLLRLHPAVLLRTMDPLPRTSQEGE
jgi:hypothetical protein